MTIMFSHYTGVFFQIGLNGASCKDWIVCINPTLVLVSIMNSHVSITESGMFSAFHLP